MTLMPVIRSLALSVVSLSTLVVDVLADGVPTGSVLSCDVVARCSASSCPKTSELIRLFIGVAENLDRTPAPIAFIDAKLAPAVQAKDGPYDGMMLQVTFILDDGLQGLSSDLQQVDEFTAVASRHSHEFGLIPLSEPLTYALTGAGQGGAETLHLICRISLPQ